MHTFDQSDLNTKLHGNIASEKFVVLSSQISRIFQFLVSRCSHKDVFHVLLM